MIEMKVAHRDHVYRRGVEAGALQSRDDPRPLVSAHVAGLVVDTIADPRLDEDAPRRRLDQKAVQGLEEAILRIDLVADPAVPEDPGHRPEQRAGVRAKGSRLDEGDRRAAAEIAPPVDGVVQRRGSGSGLAGDSPAPRPFEKSRWKADAVGSDWPWYFEPSSGEP